MSSKEEDEDAPNKVRGKPIMLEHLEVVYYAKCLHLISQSLGWLEDLRFLRSCTSSVMHQDLGLARRHG